MHHTLLLITTYAAFVLQLTGTVPGSANLLATVALLALVTTNGRTALVWVAAIGLLDDVLHTAPFGLTMATATLAALFLWKPARDDAPVVRWTARLLFTIAFVAVPHLARGLLTGAPFTLPAAAVLHTLAVVAAAWLLYVVTLRFLHGRPQRHGF